jgi:hypothetical protein
MSDSRKYLPENQVRARYGVSDMSLKRWDQDPNLAFPKPRGRKYRAQDELDAFDERMRAASVPDEAA